MSEFFVEQLDSMQLPLVNKFYKSCRYSAKAGRDDCVFVVRGQEGIVAAVRLQLQRPNVYFLRSMCVSPDCRRQGLGGFLLDNLTDFLKDSLCYCYPFDYLGSFYGAFGFVEVPQENAPPYMLEAYQRYVRQGRKLLLMVREPQ